MVLLMHRKDAAMLEGRRRSDWRCAPALILALALSLGCAQSVSPAAMLDMRGLPDDADRRNERLDKAAARPAPENRQPVPVVVEVTAGPEGTQALDGLGAGQRPARAGATHAVRHKVAPLDRKDHRGVLAAHPDVAKCACIGVADELKDQVPVGFLVLKAVCARPRRSPPRWSAWCANGSDRSPAKLALVMQRLPKTRSGKILRGTMRSLADGQEYRMPATIDDPAVLDEIQAALGKAGLAVAPRSS